MIWFPKEESRGNQMLGDPLNEVFEGGQASQRDFLAEEISLRKAALLNWRTSDEVS